MGKGQTVLPCIIDELSESIRKFAIKKNEKEYANEMDILMDKMNSIDLSHDSNKNWKVLKVNYSKLKYLYELINFYHFENQEKFSKSLDRFMETIDNTTQSYLNDINWDEPLEEYIEETNSIKKYFDESLNENESIKKLKIVLKAYEILVPMVEEFRNEKYQTEIDPDFLETFEQPKKKLKKN
jgi:hypothetical protein